MFVFFKFKKIFSFRVVFGGSHYPSSSREALIHVSTRSTEESLNLSLSCRIQWLWAFYGENQRVVQKCGTVVSQVFQYEIKKLSGIQKRIFQWLLLFYFSFICLEKISCLGISHPSSPSVLYQLFWQHLLLEDLMW